MQFLMRNVAVVAALAGLLGMATAQVPERTIDEVKQESLARAQRGADPLGGLNPADVADALGRIKTRERDDWADGFGAVAERYLA